MNERLFELAFLQKSWLLSDIFFVLIFTAAELLSLLIAENNLTYYLKFLTFDSFEKIK